MKLIAIIAIAATFIVMLPLGIIDMITGHRIRLFRALTFAWFAKYVDTLFNWLKAGKLRFKFYEYITLVFWLPFFLIALVGKFIFFLSSRLDLARPLPSGLPGHVGVDEDGHPREEPLRETPSGPEESENS